MNEIEGLLHSISKHWGWHVGNKVKQEIEAVIGAQDVDIQQLQSAIETIQGLLDADPDTPEFDVGQNIVTQLSDHLSRITSLETDVATLKGDENTVGSVAYAVKQERDRAQAAEAGLQSEIDAIEAGAGLNDDGSYTANPDANYISDATSLKDADDKLDAAINSVGAAAVATAKQYADETFVKKEDVAAISAETLASMFRSAMDCGFNGASIEDVIGGTGDCAQANGGGDGDGAVL